MRKGLIKTCDVVISCLKLRRARAFVEHISTADSFPETPGWGLVSWKRGSVLHFKFSYCVVCECVCCICEF